MYFWFKWVQLRMFHPVYGLYTYIYTIGMSLCFLLITYIGQLLYSICFIYTIPVTNGLRLVDHLFTKCRINVSHFNIYSSDKKNINPTPTLESRSMSYPSLNLGCSLNEVL